MKEEIVFKFEKKKLIQENKKYLLQKDRICRKVKNERIEKIVNLPEANHCLQKHSWIWNKNIAFEDDVTLFK